MAHQTDDDADDLMTSNNGSHTAMRCCFCCGLTVAFKFTCRCCLVVLLGAALFVVATATTPATTPTPSPTPSAEDAIEYVDWEDEGMVYFGEFKAHSVGREYLEHPRFSFHGAAGAQGADAESGAAREWRAKLAMYAATPLGLKTSALLRDLQTNETKAEAARVVVTLNADSPVLADGPAQGALFPFAIPIKFVVDSGMRAYALPLRVLSVVRSADCPASGL